MKKKLLFICFFNSIILMSAQTLEELKSEQATKKDSIATLQSKVDALQSQIDALPGWRYRAFGTIGANLSGFDKWYSRDAANNSSGNIGVTVNGIANLIQEKYFWRNYVNLNVSWIKNDNKDISTDSNKFDSATDVFNITSLYGYNISKKIAVSTLAEYRTTIIDNFNDPGYLDSGIGMTWTPINDLVVVVQPLDFNYVFSSEGAIFDSSFGAKIVADYSKKIKAIDFKTNLSLFESYESNNLSSWTWINSFSYTLWKGIGVGFEFGLRQNKQEALNFALNNLDPLNLPATLPDFDTIDNDLQSYWLFGLSYAFNYKK
jgi:hypothetical protein